MATATRVRTTSHQAQHRIQHQQVHTRTRTKSEKTNTNSRPQLRSSRHRHDLHDRAEIDKARPCICLHNHRYDRSSVVAAGTNTLVEHTLCRVWLCAISRFTRVLARHADSSRDSYMGENFRDPGGFYSGPDTLYQRVFFSEPDT